MSNCIPASTYLEGVHGGIGIQAAGRTFAVSHTLSRKRHCTRNACCATLRWSDAENRQNTLQHDGLSRLTSVASVCASKIWRHSRRVQSPTAGSWEPAL